MAGISFPSPETLLGNRHTPPDSPTLTSKKNTRPASSKDAVKKKHTKVGQDGIKQVKTQKPKQTKSRDGMTTVPWLGKHTDWVTGCITCKEKRLKCDETHPHCLQCKRRKVTCGGYKRTFTFRSLDKFTFAATSGCPKAKQRESQTAPTIPITPVSPQFPPPLPSLGSSFEESLGSNDSFEEEFQCPTKEAFQPLQDDFFAVDLSQNEAPETFYHLTYEPSPSPQRLFLDNDAEQKPFYGSNEPTPEDDFYNENDFFDQNELLTPCLSYVDTPSPQDAHFPMPSMAFRQRPGGLDEDSPPFELEEDVEEITREGVIVDGHFPWTCPSPAPTTASSMNRSFYSPLTNLLLRPEDSGLLRHLFHTETCRILSIKNGDRENPWTSMLWPMMLEDRALYYAMLSMTASHAVKKYPSLRFKALELMTTSIECFRSDLPVMRMDTALATTLVLAFSESWHSHIYTGIMHLRGARKLITQGLIEQEQGYPYHDTLKIRFLRGTWVYMDVIARLTAMGGDDPGDLDGIAAPPMGPEAPVHEIDPLMGCATTLFPLIGAVANLVKLVRRTEKDQKIPLQVVTKAACLRDQIIKWRIPGQFVEPRDASLDIDHSRQTADAYRWATLLYLFQAVPMICTRTPADLAEKTLCHLAAVPVTSSATIIQIFPLLAAGCEAVTEDDRAFVATRWGAMMDRMCIGNLDRCWDVVKEVWERRDAASIFQRRNSSSSLDLSKANATTDTHEMPEKHSLFHHPGGIISEQHASGTDQATTRTLAIDPRMTVRGRLHWVAVMSDREWESKSFAIFVLVLEVPTDFLRSPSWLTVSTPYLSPGAGGPTKLVFQGHAQ